MHAFAASAHYDRRTACLAGWFTHISVALGGKAGGCLPRDLEIVVSADTLAQPHPLDRAPESRDAEGLERGRLRPSVPVRRPPPTRLASPWRDALDRVPGQPRDLCADLGVPVKPSLSTSYAPPGAAGRLAWGQDQVQHAPGMPASSTSSPMCSAGFSFQVDDRHRKVSRQNRRPSRPACDEPGRDQATSPARVVVRRAQ